MEIIWNHQWWANLKSQSHSKIPNLCNSNPKSQDQNLNPNPKSELSQYLFSHGNCRLGFYLRGAQITLHCPFRIIFSVFCEEVRDRGQRTTRHHLSNSRAILAQLAKKLNTENDRRLAKIRLSNLAPQIESQKITNRIESQSFMLNHSQKLSNHSQKTLKSRFKSQSRFRFAQHWKSHSVTCHPTQVNAPPSPLQPGTRFTYPGGMKGWELTWVRLAWLNTKTVNPRTVTHPSTTVLTGHEHVLAYTFNLSSVARINV